MQTNKQARLQYPAAMPKEPDPLQQISNNLMEVLVLEEIERQLGQVSQQQRKFLSKSALLAFTLNRLPALYATSQRGRSLQEKQARTHWQSQIEQVVHQAIAAVTNDPLKGSLDSWQSPRVPELETIIQELQELLRYEQISPDNLVDVIKVRILQSARGEFFLEEFEGLDWEKYPLHQRSGG